MNQLVEEKLESLRARIESLEGEMKRDLEEKSLIEKSKSEKEFEIRFRDFSCQQLLDHQRHAFSHLCFQVFTMGYKNQGFQGFESISF